MKFAKGYFGACIVVLALLGTGLAGFFMDVEKDTRQTTNYEYVADVSGLFSYTDAPQYIEYNPSSNLTGYDTGIIYTPSNVVNNYRYKVSDGASTSSTYTFSNSSSYPWDFGTWRYGHSDYGYLQLPKVQIYWDGSIDFGSSVTNEGFTWNARINMDGNSSSNYHVHITKFSNILSAMNIGSQYATATINVTYDTTMPVMFYAGDWVERQIAFNDGYAYSYCATLNENNSMPDRFEINLSANLVSAYRGTELIWAEISDNVGVLAWYRTASVWGSDVNCSVTFDAVLREADVYGYMQPTAGVKATNTLSTWENGYSNSLIDLKIIKNGDTTTYPQSVQLQIGSSLVGFIYTGSEFKLVEGAISDLDAPNTTLGAWLGVQLRIDTLNGDIIVTPTNDLNMLTSVQPTDYSTTLEDYFTPGVITEFKVSTGSATNTSLKFQVTNTMVFLNTYNVVMIDPAFDIEDYFPNYSEYRLNFYSFAIIGDAMTINGNTYPVNREDATITITDIGGFVHNHKLENIYITNVDGHTYITFVNANVRYDLGETVDTEVSFDGMWYFTTVLYKAVDGLETFWDWNIDGSFHANAGECLLIFIGIIALGVIVYSVFSRGKVELLDWLVIIFAVFIGSAMLGF